MTIKHWFETLQEPIRTQALNNLYVKNAEVESLGNALMVGFSWDETPEGWDYWNKIQLEAERKNKLNTNSFTSIGVLILLEKFKLALALDPNITVREWFINNA